MFRNRKLLANLRPDHWRAPACPSAGPSTFDSPGKVVAVLALACAVASCAAKKTPTADEYFQEAAQEMRDGAYQAAAAEYRELLDQYPFSDYSEEAELKIAHAHFLAGQCTEAIAAFSDFQRRHPTSPHLPFVGYLIGQCYEKQMRPADRDQSASQNAQAYYLAVVQQYPDSPYADLAKARMKYCRERLAEHEILVALFYRKRGNTQAAEYRLLDLVNGFNDTDVAGDALYDLGALYARQGEDEKAALAFASVSEHHPYNHMAAKAAQQLKKLPSQDLPNGDPLVVLQAQSGRARPFEMARAIGLPEAPATKHPAGFAPPIGAYPGAPSGPFGGRGY
jgi:outer membrane protein assembly factor BamD